MKKTLWILLCLLLLSGCGADGGGAEEKATADRSDTFYTTEYLSFDAQVDEVVDSAMDGTSIYLLGDRYLDGGDSFCLLRLPLDGGDLEELPDYAPASVPDGTEGYVYAVGLFVGTDETLWVREVGSYYTLDLPEDFDPETGNRMDYRTGGGDLDVLRQLDASGAELRQIDLAALLEPIGMEKQEILTEIADTSMELYVSLGIGGYVFDYAVDGAENLYLLTLGTLYVLDSRQNLLFTLEWEGVYGTLLSLSGGGFAVQSYGRESRGSLTGCGVRAVDLETRDWGQEYPLSDEITSVWSGLGDWLFFYTGGDSLYAWDAAADVETRLTVWDKDRIDPGLLTCCAMLPDGRIAALLDRNGKPEAAVLTEADPDALPEAATLTYAVLSQDYVDWEAVNEFNRTHTDVQIEVKDYSVYDNETAVGARSGREQLLLEIAAGHMPDIVELGVGSNTLPYRQLAQKGYLEDLWPYIENDPDLGRESLMEAPLKAAEVDGGLYMAFDTVSIQTLVGAASVVGDRYSWSLQDMQTALAAMPEGSTVSDYYLTKITMFYILKMSLDSYVDWETGTCSFDSESFRAALEFINSFPAEFAWTDDVNEETNRRILEGQQLTALLAMDELDDIQRCDAAFGGRASFVGFPVEDGSAGSYFMLSSPQLAMFSSCQNKDAAWELIRLLFLPHDNAKRLYGIPVNRTDFEYLTHLAMTREDEETVPIWYLDTPTMELHPATEEEYQRFMDFFHHVEKTGICDMTVLGIVQELCTPYFAGDRTLDETIRLIQDQVSLYVMEQK